jgi:hypothetical protein
MPDNKDPTPTWQQGIPRPTQRPQPEVPCKHGIDYSDLKVLVNQTRPKKSSK